jgi:glucokinase
MSDIYWVGVDLGGTKTLAGVFDDRFHLAGRAKESTPYAQGPGAVFETVARAVEKALKDAGVGPDKVRGLGMGLPGQIDASGTRVKYAPNLDWRDLDVTAHIPKAWTWPTFVENDVRVGTFGEWKHGAARGARHVLGVFVGTGVGGALIIDGKLYYGFNHNAGEIGHTIINWRKGTELESVAGRRWIVTRAKQLLDDAPKRVRKEWKGVDLAAVKSALLAEFYQKDDPVAVQLLDDAARALGAAIGSLVNLLSPEVIVLGGGVTEALGDHFVERVWEIASRFALPGATDGVRFVAAALKDDSGIIGAAAIAKARVTGE